MKADAHQFLSGEVQLPCNDLEQTVQFFTGDLGFSVDSVFPADDPRSVVLSGYGMRLRLCRDAGGDPGTLRLYCMDRSATAAGKTELVAPNGTRILLQQADRDPFLPALDASLVISRVEGECVWHTGRAGMQYRDLIPGRQGGRFIGSHIRIEDAGPVPDYVHYHRLHWQLIYCYRGWVKVVYEKQGGPFELHPGDCVLQPPGIRHRVLESSAGLEVIEIGCPAEHETVVDHDLVLPTADLDCDSEFAGQRFVRHRADRAEWQASRVDGFVCRDLGMSSGTAGIVGASVLRPEQNTASVECGHQGELDFSFVLDGGAALRFDDGRVEKLAAGDACTIPQGISYLLFDCSRDLEILRVNVPAPDRTESINP